MDAESSVDVEKKAPAPESAIDCQTGQSTSPSKVGILDTGDKSAQERRGTAVAQNPNINSSSNISGTADSEAQVTSVTNTPAVSIADETNDVTNDGRHKESKDAMNQGDQKIIASPGTGQPTAATTANSSFSTTAASPKSIEIFEGKMAEKKSAITSTSSGVDDDVVCTATTILGEKDSQPPTNQQQSEPTLGSKLESEERNNEASTGRGFGQKPHSTNETTSTVHTFASPAVTRSKRKLQDHQHGKQTHLSPQKQLQDKLIVGVKSSDPSSGSTQSEKRQKVEVVANAKSPNNKNENDSEASKSDKTAGAATEQMSVNDTKPKSPLKPAPGAVKSSKATPAAADKASRKEEDAAAVYAATSQAQAKWIEAYVELSSRWLLDVSAATTAATNGRSGNPFDPVDPSTSISALGYLRTLRRRPTAVETWNPREIVLFEAALAHYGKHFGRVQKEIATKTVAQVIEFYYIWKKTTHYKTWKETYVPPHLDHSDDEDERSPTNSKKGGNGNKTGGNRTITTSTSSRRGSNAASTSNG